MNPFSKQRNLAVKMCLLFPKRPFRAHDKSDVAAVDLHFTFQIAAKGTKIGRGIEALCVFIECPDIQRQAVKPFLFRLCLAKSEQRRPDTVPAIFFVYSEFFNVIETLGAYISRFQTINILYDLLCQRREPRAPGPAAADGKAAAEGLRRAVHDRRG